MPIVSSFAGISARAYGLFSRLLLKWKTVDVDFGAVMLSATYAPLSNAKYFAFGASGSGNDTTYYNYTNEEGSWTNSSWVIGTLPRTYEWGASSANSTRIVVFPSGNNGGTVPKMAYSDNGTTWTLASMPYPGSTYQLFQSIWDGARFLVTSNSTSQGLFTSSTGTSWSSVVAFASNSIGFNGSSTYIMTSSSTSSSTGRICTSNPTVAANWTSITFPSTGAWISVVYGNGVWVALRAGSTAYATSTNGTSWTARTLPYVFSASTSDIYSKAVFSDGKFYYSPGANTTYPQIYESTDGINWSLAYNDTLNSIMAGSMLAASPTKVFVAGYTTLSNDNGDIMVGEK